MCTQKNCCRSVCPLAKKSLLVCLSFSNGNAGASHRTHSFVALGALLMKKEKTSMVATSMEGRSRLREQKHDGSTNLVLRVICEQFFLDFFTLNFL